MREYQNIFTQVQSLLLITPGFLLAMPGAIAQKE